MKKESSGVFALAFGLALVCLMPTNQSIWIDEGFTVPYAQEPTLGRFLTRLASEQGSEALMPLGMFSSWAGTQVFGMSEIGLRAVSALWAAVAVVLLWRTGVAAGVAWLPALFACHPFLWYYASEVRPYAMVIAMSSGVLYGLVTVLSSERGTEGGLYTLLFFGPLLCATQVLGVVPLAVVAVVVGRVLLRRGWKPGTRDAVFLALSGGAFILLGLYDAMVISRGADINWEGPWTVGVSNLLFSAYELFGFTGLGPGRYELRQLAIEHGLLGSLRGLARPATVALIALAVLYALTLIRFLRRLESRRSFAGRLVLLCGLVIAASATLMFALCAAVESPFWGRHLASLLPFVVLGLGIAGSPPEDNRQRKPAIMTLLLAAALLASSVMQRLDPRYSRDDYRGAAHLASLALQKGKVVWWVAAFEAATYYRVVFCPVGPNDAPACVVRADNRESWELEEWPKPDLVLLSKPELYDMTGAVRRYIQEHRFQATRRLTAFEAFESR